MRDFSSSVLSSLEALFLQFNFRRLLFWTFVIGGGILLLFVLEQMTGYTFFMRMEKKAELLSDLHNLSKDGISSNSELSPIYFDMVSELNKYKTEELSIPQITARVFSLNVLIQEKLWKFISAASLGLLVALAGLVDKKKGTSNWSSTFFGGLLFGIFTGIVGSIIPTIYNLWINLVAYPVIQIAVVLFFSSRTKKKVPSPDTINA